MAGLVLGMAGKRTVQVHQVQAPRALVDPTARHGRRVFAKGGGLVHVALFAGERTGRLSGQSRGLAAWEVREGDGAIRCRSVIRDSSGGSCGTEPGRGRRFFRGEIGWQKYYRAQLPP